MNNLDYIEIAPQTTAKHCIIWLHGLGADGNDFVPITKQLSLPSNLAIKYIFPHAPIMPVTLNNGQKMRAWFDIVSLTAENKFDRTEISNAITSVETLITREMEGGIPPSNILLAGFSQGASIALLTALSSTKMLAGVIALSGFLPREAITEIAASEKRKLPIFLAHGMYDPLVPCAWGKMTYEGLKDAGFSPEWHTYPMQHQVSDAEVNDISAFIKQIWH